MGSHDHDMPAAVAMVHSCENLQAARYMYCRGRTVAAPSELSTPSQRSSEAKTCSPPRSNPRSRCYRMGNGALSGGTKETSTVPPPSSGIQAIDLKQARSVLRQTMESPQAPKILRDLEPAEVALLAEASDPVC